MSKPTDQPREAVLPSPTTQQGDNIAHALAGAGGGLLSMTLTSVYLTHPFIPTTYMSYKIPPYRPLHPRPSRVQTRTLHNHRRRPAHRPTRGHYRPLRRT